MYQQHALGIEKPCPSAPGNSNKGMLCCGATKNSLKGYSLKNVRRQNATTQLSTIIFSLF
jgi:hypothetical protein